MINQNRKPPGPLDPGGSFLSGQVDLVGLLSLDRDTNLDLIAHEGCELTQIEIAADQCGGRVKTRPWLVCHRVITDLVQLRVQNDRFGDTVHGQIAGDIGRVVSGNFDPGRGEGDQIALSDAPKKSSVIK